MVSANLKIINEKGLHARASAKLVNLVQSFADVGVTVRVDQKSEDVPADDVLELLTLGASQGMHITVTVSGKNEDKVLAEITQLVQNGFGE